MLEKKGIDHINGTQSFIKGIFRQLVGMEKRARHAGFQAFDIRSQARQLGNDPVYQYVPIINRTSSRAIYRTQGWFMHVRE